MRWYETDSLSTDFPQARGHSSWFLIPPEFIL